MPLTTSTFNTILENFYGTTHLPILALDTYGDIVGQVPSLTLNPLKNLIINKILNNIKPHTNTNRNKDISYFDLSDGSEIAVLFVYISDKLNNYFLIGPYNVSSSCALEICSKNNYIRKPKQCIEYSIQILNNIIEDTLIAKNLSEVPLNLNIKRAINFINVNYENEISIDSISDELNINKCYFCTLFKKETGMTFSNYLNKKRIDKSKELLKSTDLSMLDIAVTVGFNNQNYFAMAFKKEVGIPPLQYRKDNFKS